MVAAKVEEVTRRVEDRHALLARIDDLRAEQRELYAKCIKAEKAELEAFVAGVRNGFAAVPATVVGATSAAGATMMMYLATGM